MLALPLPELPAPVAPTALFAASTLHALAREEAAGRRPKRLLEEKRAARKTAQFIILRRTTSSNGLLASTLGPKPAEQDREPGAASVKE